MALVAAEAECFGEPAECCVGDSAGSGIGLELVELVEDGFRVKSELVTNAVLYGEAEESWRVRVEWWRVGEALRVDVHNPGFPAKVRMREAAADESHGRSLCLVDALADSWSAGASRFGGTVVWFSVDEAWKP
ncbi:ATP-binding protein [Streptomyces caniferus]|uniref:ATP-binding protein n=1 Tax=Streptomyces caniferus TaxID=285557 RepID=UPI003400D935